ncbi:hypothetical protein SNE40_021784 [Patella caerulea]|uniref:C2H2-type domain-containing protein n=1 Tax=Patella caerulea TaxID=87958 RepID=A0AAN8G091_PATCE
MNSPEVMNSPNNSTVNNHFGPPVAGDDIILIDNEDPKILKCCICRQIFPDNLTLQIHLKCHIGDKPYKCSYCECS